MARPQRCPSGYSCVNVGQSPNHGLTGFDNVRTKALNVQRIHMDDVKGSLR